MNEQKLTDWFPPEVLPARPGPYQIEDDAILCVAFWRGDGWGFASWKPGQEGVEACAKEGFRQANASWIRGRRWRGLAEPPLTDWFDPDTPPEREGVYETDESDKDGRCFAYWDGEKFGYRCWEHIVKGGAEAAIQRAHEQSDVSTGFPGLTRWRGLAVQP